jgi:hypothetical protein
MIYALAVLTGVAALAAYRAPVLYMQAGALRIAAQIAAVLLALILGSMVASWGPQPVSGPSFHQVVAGTILVLGVAMRQFLKDK